MEFKVARLNFRKFSSSRWLLTITISASPLTWKIIIEINIAVGHLHKVWLQMSKAHKSEKSHQNIENFYVIKVIHYILPVTDWANIISAFKFYFTVLTFKWIVHREIIHREWLRIRCNESHQWEHSFFCTN